MENIVKRYNMDKLKKIRKFVAVGSAADALAVDRHTIQNYLKRGIFPGARRLPSGHWRIPIAEVNRIAEADYARK